MWCIVCKEILFLHTFAIVTGNVNAFPTVTRGGQCESEGAHMLHTILVQIQKNSVFSAFNALRVKLQYVNGCFISLLSSYKIHKLIMLMPHIVNSAVGGISLHKLTLFACFWVIVILSRFSIIICHAFLFALVGEKSHIQWNHCRTPTLKDTY